MVYHLTMASNAIKHSYMHGYRMGVRGGGGGHGKINQPLHLAPGENIF